MHIQTLLIVGILALVARLAGADECRDPAALAGHASGLQAYADPRTGELGTPPQLPSGRAASAADEIAPDLPAPEFVVAPTDPNAVMVDLGNRFMYATRVRADAGGVFASCNQESLPAGGN